MSFEAKIADPAVFAQRARALARPLVFTNGVFDILHRGHVTYLAQARALGAALVVALNSDASARRLGKGDDRPINTLADRMAVIAALESVALVTSFVSGQQSSWLKPGDPSQQALTFWALLHGYAMLLIDHRLDDLSLNSAASRATLLEQFLSNLFNGLERR